MRALISGQAGIAVLIDGDQYTSIEVPFYEPVQRTGQDVGYLVGDATDLLELENTSSENVAQELGIAWRKDRSLQLALIALDGQADPENRASAARCLASLLSDAATIDFLENRLFVAPLPEAANLETALKLAALSESREFARILLTVSDAQDSIRKIRLAWDAMRPDVFGGPVQKERFGFAAVQSGAFRLLAQKQSDEARVRFREVDKQQQLGANWDIPSLFKRWQKLASLADDDRPDTLPVQRTTRTSGNPTYERPLASLAQRAMLAIAAVVLLALLLFRLLNLGTVSAKDSVTLTPGATAGLKATDALLRHEVRFSLRRAKAIAYFQEAEQAISDGRFSEAARLYEESDRTVNTAAAQLNFGIAVYNTGDPQKAARILLAGLVTARADSNPVLVTAFLVNLANVYRDQGLLDDALKQYDEASETAKTYGYEYALAAASLNRGLLLDVRGSLSGSYSQLRYALQIYRRNGDKRGEAETFLAASSYVAFVAGIFDDWQLLTTALDDLKWAAALYKDLPGPLAEASYHYTLGKTYFLQAYDSLAEESTMAQAAEEYQKANALYESIGYKRGQFLAVYDLASAYAFENYSIQAGNSWLRCLTLAKEMGSPFREAITYNGIANHHLRSHDYRAASESFQEAARLATNIGAYGCATTALMGLGDVSAAKVRSRLLRSCHRNGREER